MTEAATIIRALEANGYEKAEELRKGVHRLAGLDAAGVEVNKIAFVHDSMVGTNYGTYQRRQVVDIVSPVGVTLWSGSFEEVLSLLVTPKEA